MALSNQSPGALKGVTPLAYAGTTPNMVFNTRRPTSKDVFNFELGTWWIIPKKKSGAAASDPTREVWILVGNAQQTASWKKLRGGAGPAEDSSVKVTVLSTPGSGTFTFDPSMDQVQVECQGGGSGGGGNTGTDTVYSGSSGGYCKKLFTASVVGSSQNYVVGSGGSGSIGAAQPGNGTITTFGSFLSAGGGTSGFASGGPGNVIPLGGTATGGDINIGGQPGQYFEQGASSNFGSPDGMDSALGIGGGFGLYYQVPAPTFFNGGNGSGYGSGGGCGYANGANATGGNGAPGVIIITEYLS